MKIRVIEDDEIAITKSEFDRYSQEYKQVRERFEKVSLAGCLTFEEYVRQRKEYRVLDVVAQTMKNNGVNIRGELRGR